MAFNDNRCPGLYLPESLQDEFYVYVGASQDVAGLTARFYNFDIRSDGAGMAEMEAWGVKPKPKEALL